MTPHENAIARIVAGMELVARGLTMRPDSFDHPLTPVADEVQRLADELREAEGDLQDLRDEIDGIHKTCMEVLDADDEPSGWAPGEVRLVVEKLKAAR